jgi:hypothetical protein
MPGARDEYGIYVNGVFELMVNGASDDAIAQHLLKIVIQRMELTGVTSEQMGPTVVALRAINLPL